MALKWLNTVLANIQKSVGVKSITRPTDRGSGIALIVYDEQR